MIKNSGTAETIREEILRRIQGNADLGDNCRDCDVQIPRKVNPATNSGCNWIIDEFPGVKQECLTLVKAIVIEMMREYDLN
ncbi:hypothetical protein SAMN05446935_8535 [Burkholderia sp. YR290]|nr:hypothetical protein SAMN05446935_8535 [Burkholderia sp. YR290]